MENKAVPQLRNMVETQGQQQECGTTKPTDGRNMKFGGGKGMQKMPSQPSARLLKHRRLATAHWHHNYDTVNHIAHGVVQWTMHTTKQTRWSMRAMTTNCLISSNQMMKENTNVSGGKPVKNDPRDMLKREEAKQNVWAAAEHYENLLNIEFEDPEHLSNELPLEGPPIP